MDILISVAAKVAEYTVAPIRRQLNYLFYYHKNIKNHEEQLENLKIARERVQNLVDDARGNGDEINNDVSTWLNKVDVELPNMPQQNEEVGSNNASCLNLVQRHQLSRKSTKKVKYIIELIDEGKMFDKVGHPAPLPVTRSSTLPVDYQILESRTLIAEKIKDALADSSVNKVGVCGMGGVGKTKLLDEVKKLVLENKLFDRVIDVTVGQSNGILEIQDQIGGQLNMGLNKKAKTEKGRAHFLRNKLVEMNKDNILIMLDDLWKDYDLEKEVGIPCRLESRKEGCKIIMTSRFRDLLANKMNTEKCFKVNFLSEEESWKFFMEIVGEFDKNCIEHIAKDVVEQCGGLPLALEIIAKALKGKEVRIWKDALKQLKNPVSVNIEGVGDQMFSSLKLSYNFIKDEAQLLFLLCSVFPDDHNICVKDLQMYAIGMGLLNDINNWEDARNRVIKLVDDLKSSSLLLECNFEDNNYVRMHDVVRDVAKDIASRKDKMSSLCYGHGQSEWLEKDRCGSYNAIFVDCTDIPNLPLNLKFPNLQLLILRNPWWTSSGAEIPNAFFEGMKEIRVLDLTNLSIVKPLWTSLTQLLKNLHVLCVSSCECNDIDTIGQLKKLEILRIYDCMIQELPQTMSQLTQLKVLDLLCCSNLEVIPQNIISSMTNLEELSIWRCFTRLREEVLYKNKLIKNVKLSELEHLTRLFNLRLEISNVDDLSLERVRKLEEFCICVGDNDIYFDKQTREQYWRGKIITDGYARTLMLNIKSQIVSINGALQILLERCEELLVDDSVGFAKHLFKPKGNYGYPHLKRLHMYIDRNSEMPRRIDLQVSFPELKDLIIRGGNNLEMLWHNNGLSVNSFCKLQHIGIERCNKLTYVFPSNMVTSLVFLSSLNIGDCELLERIFEIENLAEDVKVVPLTKLNLSHLPSLKYVWNNDPSEFLTFPNLKEVYVFRCPQLNSIFPASFIKHMKAMTDLWTPDVNEIFSENEASKLMFHEIVLFPSLRRLTIPCKLAVKKGRFWLASESSPKLQTLRFLCPEGDRTVTLPLEVSKEASRIEEFGIMDAFHLVQVFQNGEESNHNGGAKLKILGLYNLPSLTDVWKDNTQMTTNFDSLKRIRVKKCGKLKCLLPSSVTFLNLTTLSIKNCNGMLNLFSSSVAKNLVNLEKIKIFGCGGMSSVVAAEAKGEGEEKNGDEIIFNKLTTLVLCNLQRLASFSGKCPLKLPSLEFLSIKECPKMRTFPYGIKTRPKLEVMRTEENEVPELQDFHEDENMDNINNFFTEELVQVLSNEEEMNHIQGRRVNLKTLKLSNFLNLTHVWKDNTQMTINFGCLEYFKVDKCDKLKCLLPSSITLFNLVELYVSNCNGMLNLFSSSIARKLVNLKYITISNCGGLSSIVAAGGEEESCEIIFNKLILLRLCHLPRLASFHSGKCALKFPCMTWLEIEGCPEMKTFSYGIVNTPELVCMKIEEDEIRNFSEAENINIIIQDFSEDGILRSIKSLFTQESKEDNEEDIAFFNKEYSDDSEPFGVVGF